MSKTRGKNKNKNTIRRRKNKNSIQKSRGKHRRKTMKYLGGAPKLDFPYVYYPVSKVLLDNSPVLNQYIHWRNCCCGKRSDGMNEANILLQCGDPMRQAIPANPSILLADGNMALIIVLKYNNRVKVERNPNLLNDLAFLYDNILGHSIVKIVDNVACIYDVCGHHPEKKGYGKVLFNSIMQFIKDVSPSIKTDHCWLGISLYNVFFDKVANIYTSAGFSKGHVTNLDPWGQRLPILFVSLRTIVDKDIVNEQSTRIDLYKLLQLTAQFMHCVNTNTNYSTFTFRFDKNCIINLRLLPFASTQTINNISVRTIESIKDNIQNSNNRELSGIFHIYNVDEVQQVGALERYVNSVYVLSLSTIHDESEENNSYVIHDTVKYTQGPDEAKFSVKIYVSSYTFHTHPIQGYYDLKMFLAPPSATDLYFFLFNVFVAPSVRPKFIVPQLHVVVTLEGIYVISLHKDAMEHIAYIITHIQPLLHQFIPTLEYPLPNRHYDWPDDAASDELVPVDIVTTGLAAYQAWFDAKNKLNDPVKPGVTFNLFKLDIIRWSELTDEFTMQVNCPLIHGNPFVDTKDFMKGDDKLIGDLNKASFYTSKTELQGTLAEVNKYYAEHGRPEV